MNAPPFQLTPDPAFYFESLTHRKAMSYLSYGLAQGEGLSAVFDKLRAPPEQSVGFTIAVIALGAKMAKADGLVTRQDYGEIPPRVDYRLTTLGRSLEPVLLAGLVSVAVELALASYPGFGGSAAGAPPPPPPAPKS